MDLNNFLKFCHGKVNLHPEFVLNQCDPNTISYIRPFCLSGVEKPIVGYIYKKHTPKVVNSIAKNCSSSEDEEYDELELTGNPLECPFSPIKAQKVHIEINKPEDSHIPLNLLQARQLVYLKLKDEQFLSVPLFILCDGLKNNTILLGGDISEGWHSRYWGEYKGRNDVAHDELSVQTMIETHKQFPQASTMILESKVSAVINLTSATNTEEFTFIENGPGMVILNLSWRRPSLFAPLMSTESFINVQCTLGHETSPLHSLWHQLLFLEDLIEQLTYLKDECLTNRHNIVFPQFQGDIRGSANGQIVEMFPAMLQSISSTLYKRGKFGGQEDNDQKLFCQCVRDVIAAECIQQEFTDKLWTYLLECKSYNDLIECFKHLYKAVRNETFKPLIKSTNGTRLAQILKSLPGNTASNPEKLYDPVQLLIEIGIEKLKNDYTQSFLISKIALADHLKLEINNKFCNIDYSDWWTTLNSWMIWLCRVHTVLDLAAVTESMLNITTQSMMPVITNALRYYLGDSSPIKAITSVKTLPLQIFRSSINTHFIEHHIPKAFTYDSWTLQLTSQNCNRRVISIFHRNAENILPKQIYKDVTNGETKEKLMDQTTLPLETYYCINFHVLSDHLS
ncbi:uncharacterized protein LOC132950955 [Metopolophium dirhodum]|uniref:uncharacterized protein LOC132950955 n=1 Tax=Metopolophium dirhodum TaxID=44670 RepID=UPI00298F618D|nr:uncharacterized protein LOC132950955 [Metopolophium dirhodum]XP_060878580.1 uncharacterized protein LOC132950955 [Metopolophium dirhodum]